MLVQTGWDGEGEKENFRVNFFLCGWAESGNGSHLSLVYCIITAERGRGQAAKERERGINISK